MFITRLTLFLKKFIFNDNNNFHIYFSFIFQTIILFKLVYCPLTQYENYMLEVKKTAFLVLLSRTGKPSLLFILNLPFLYKCNQIIVLNLLSLHSRMRCEDLSHSQQWYLHHTFLINEPLIFRRLHHLILHT